MTQIVRLTIGKRADMAEQIAAIRDENLDLQMRRAELLTEHGFGLDYLDEIVSCPKCRDTGLFEGKICDCLDRLYNMELTKELGTLMRRGDECFEKFDLMLYPNDYDADSNCIPRERMGRVLEVCRNYAENFSANSRNLLFQGGTGLGKTYISACIAGLWRQRADPSAMNPLPQRWNIMSGPSSAATLPRARRQPSV